MNFQNESVPSVYISGQNDLQRLRSS